MNEDASTGNAGLSTALLRNLYAALLRLMCAASHWHWHHMAPMTSSMAHDTDASTDIKSNKIPLNNHLNMTNAMLSFMALSATCDWQHLHVCAKTNKTPKYHILATYAKGFMCRYETNV